MSICITLSIECTWRQRYNRIHITTLCSTKICFIIYKFHYFLTTDKTSSSSQSSKQTNKVLVFFLILTSWAWIYLRPRLIFLQIKSVLYIWDRRLIWTYIFSSSNNNREVNLLWHVQLCVTLVIVSTLTRESMPWI